MTERVPVSPSSEASVPTATRTGKYSTFELGGEVYGLEFLKLQEIIGTMVDIDRVLSGEEIGSLEKGA